MNIGHPDYEAPISMPWRLERDLAPALVYHNLAHTRDDVVPAVEYLTSLAGWTVNPYNCAYRRLLS